MSNHRELKISDMNEYLTNPDLNVANNKLFEKTSLPEIIIQLSLCDDFSEDLDYDSEEAAISGLLIRLLDRVIKDSSQIIDILANEKSREILIFACKNGYDNVRVLIAKKIKYALDFKDVNDEIHSIAWEMLFDPYFSVYNHISKMLLRLLYEGNSKLFTEKNIDYLANFIKIDTKYMVNECNDAEQIISYKLRILDFVVDSSVISSELYNTFSRLDIFGYIFKLYKCEDLLLMLNALQIAEKYIMSHLDIKFLNLTLSEDCQTLIMLFDDLKTHANEYLVNGVTDLVLSPLLEIITTIAELHKSITILMIDDYYVLKLITRILKESEIDSNNSIIFAAIHSFYSLYHVPEFTELLDKFTDIPTEMVKRLASPNEQIQHETICTFIKLAESTICNAGIFEKIFLRNVGPFILNKFSAFCLEDSRTRIYNLLELMIAPQFNSFNDFYTLIIKFFRNLDFKLQDASYAATLAKENFLQKVIKINDNQDLEDKFDQREVNLLKEIIITHS